ncbi:MAG: hypothetical protein RBS96_02055 [Dehalococcoidales bacterium]|jgi:hypothetical protein|nr:hypothetical protein [Dehalococcoidales bacterium]
MNEELWTLVIAWIVAGLAAFGYLLRRVERSEERLKKLEYQIDPLIGMANGIRGKKSMEAFATLLKSIKEMPDAESNAGVGGKVLSADEKYRNFHKALFSKQTFFVRADSGVKKDLCYYGVLMKWKSTVKYPVEPQDPFLIFDYVNHVNKLMYTTNDPEVIKDYPEYDAEKDTLIGFARELSTEEEYATLFKSIKEMSDAESDK